MRPSGPIPQSRVSPSTTPSRHCVGRPDRRASLALLVSAGLIAVSAIIALPAPSPACDPPFPLKESVNPWVPPMPSTCMLQYALNGNCGNYRWYNLCSGCIWVYSGW